MLSVKELAAKSASDINLYLLSLSVDEVFSIQDSAEREVNKLRLQIEDLADDTVNTDEGKYCYYQEEINSLQDEISSYKYITTACEQCVDVIENM